MRPLLHKIFRESLDKSKKISDDRQAWGRKDIKELSILEPNRLLEQNSKFQRLTDTPQTSTSFDGLSDVERGRTAASGEQLIPDQSLAS